jgi:ketosteroid isomerase-like protein
VPEKAVRHETVREKAQRDVTALIHHYAHCIDAGDLDGLADLFASAVLRSPRGEARGREAVRAQYDAVILGDDGRPGTHHVVFDIDVALDGDGATAEARSFVTVVQAGLPILCGRYHDRFVCEGENWRFEERVVHLDLIGDLRAHMRMAP